MADAGAAVDVEGLAGDEGGLFPEQEAVGGGEFLGRAGALHRDAVDVTLAALATGRVVGVKQLRGHGTRCDGVDGDAVRYSSSAQLRVKLIKPDFAAA